MKLVKKGKAPKVQKVQLTLTLGLGLKPMKLATLTLGKDLVGDSLPSSSRGDGVHRALYLSPHLKY
jgi:hypothetical protein